MAYHSWHEVFQWVDCQYELVTGECHVFFKSKTHNTHVIRSHSKYMGEDNSQYWAKFLWTAAIQTVSQVSTAIILSVHQTSTDQAKQA